MQQKWSELTKIAPLKNLLGNMEVLILVTNEQNCWKTESGKHFGLTPLWGSVCHLGLTGDGDYGDGQVIDSDGGECGDCDDDNDGKKDYHDWTLYTVHCHTFAHSWMVIL